MTIVPTFQLYLVNDQYPRVRAEAVRTIAHCLSNVKVVPITDANIFPEYILIQMVSLLSLKTFQVTVVNSKSQFYLISHSLTHSSPQNKYYE